MKKTIRFKLTCVACGKPFGTLVSSDARLAEVSQVLRRLDVISMCAECSTRVYNKKVKA